MLMLIIDIYRPCISVFNMSQFFFENNDVLNFLVELFFRFFTYDSYVIFFILKRFYHEPLLARKIEQSLPACTFLTLNKLSILSDCLSK